MTSQLANALQNFKLEPVENKQHNKPKNKTAKSTKNDKSTKNKQTNTNSKKVNHNKQKNQKFKKQNQNHKQKQNKKQNKPRIDIKLTDLKLDNKFSIQRNQAEILFKSHNKIESIRRDLYLERKTINGMIKALKQKDLIIDKQDNILVIAYPFTNRKNEIQHATHKFDKPFSAAVWLTRRIELLQSIIEILEEKKSNRRKYQSMQEVLIDALSNL